jgi:ribosomal protein S3
VHRVTLLNHSVIGLHKYVSSNQQEAQVCRGWCLPYRAERILTREGHSSCDVTLVRTENIIRATRTQQVFGEKGRRIRKLAALVQTRPCFPRAPSNSSREVVKLGSFRCCAA